MKLITRDADGARLEQLRRRLEENGIPAFIGGENVARIIPPVAMTQPGLWIFLDHQLDDAQALLRNPDHQVMTAVDVEAFYESQPNEETQYRQLNRALIHIALVVLAISGTLFFLAWILGRQ